MSQPNNTSIGELFKESYIVQAVITISIIFADLFIYVRSGNLPTDLLSLTWIVVGFYFGNKNTVTLLSAANRMVLNNNKDNPNNAEPKQLPNSTIIN